MAWRRRQRPRERQRDESSGIDYAATPGRHRLSDGDRVPVAGYRRYADILKDQATQELTPVRIRMTPGEEHRAGVRRWLP
jgi:hypothetical protein